MVWCLFDRDLYGEKVESLEIKIEEQARMLELARSESAAREEQLLAEQETLRAEQEARLRAEQEARLRTEQERRAMLEEALLERFPERAGQLTAVLEHLLRLSATLAMRTVLQQSWDALCRNASLEVVQGT